MIADFINWKRNFSNKCQSRNKQSRNYNQNQINIPRALNCDHGTPNFRSRTSDNGPPICQSRSQQWCYLISSQWVKHTFFFLLDSEMAACLQVLVFGVVCLQGTRFARFAEANSFHITEADVIKVADFHFTAPCRTKPAFGHYSTCTIVIRHTEKPGGETREALWPIGSQIVS